MILIATDEAGYGPKLGPLVVAGTIWKLPHGDDDTEALRAAFSELSKPVDHGGMRIKIDDSKNVFRPKSTATKSDVGYGKLQAVTLAGCHWCGLAKKDVRLAEVLSPEDAPALRRVPWLESFADEAIALGNTSQLQSRWSAGDAQLIGITSRVIGAGAFNAMCDDGFNKSDILSQATLGLVHRLIHDCQITGNSSSRESIQVFCDRHGGRRYYASPIQAAFDDTMVQVISEGKGESAYRVPYRDRPFTIRFTVKGDSFTPVAFSSMVAKYLREKAMESLNAYFARLHDAAASSPKPTSPLKPTSLLKPASLLKPTAGYPVDADRFLVDIAEIVRREEIATEALVRSR